MHCVIVYKKYLTGVHFVSVIIYMYSNLGRFIFLSFPKLSVSAQLIPYPADTARTQSNMFQVGQTCAIPIK
jgi:hypothetical protein